MWKGAFKAWNAPVTKVWILQDHLGFQLVGANQDVRRSRVLAVVEPPAGAAPADALLDNRANLKPAS